MVFLVNFFADGLKNQCLRMRRIPIKLSTVSWQGYDKLSPSEKV